jgi:DNA modification methylase
VANGHTDSQVQLVRISWWRTKNRFDCGNDLPPNERQRAAGFRIVGHLLFPKRYTGNKLHPTDPEAAGGAANADRVVLSQPGDLVLDPFAGSGSSLLAAKTLGRRWPERQPGRATGPKRPPCGGGR